MPETLSVPVTIRDPDKMRDWSRQARAQGQRIALVPTMGGLHEGHMALIDRARCHAGMVIASIFVNPAQFAPREDLATYPRDLPGDLARLAEHGCDIAYCPDVQSVYPPGDQTRILPGPLADGLEGQVRPHFFAGIVNIVCRLFHHTEPDLAVFGEKDFQQLRVIERMTRDLGLPVHIMAAPIVRSDDGLALSTRNVCLDRQQRLQAPALYRAVQDAAHTLADGGIVRPTLQAACEVLVEAGFDPLDYLQACNAGTLRPWPEDAPAPKGEEGRILVAARLGSTRLLDNVSVTRRD